MRTEKRKSLRRSVRQPAVILNNNGSILGSCTILDVSASGAKLQPRAPTEVPDDFILVLSKDAQVRRRCKIAWRSEAAIGVRFAVGDRKSIFRGI
jgi:hypothetical protein